MRVVQLYLGLDEFIKSSVETYLENVGVRLIGKNKRKHMKLLGIPSLTAMVEFTKRCPTAVIAVSTSTPEMQGAPGTQSLGF